MTESEVELFGPIVDQARSAVEGRLRLYLERLDGCPDRLLKAMAYSLLSPGKRLRPLLVLSASHVCGGEMEASLPAACAVEMIHTYSLIHDDLPAMDDDDLRRGQASCHIAFDEATAILAGDALIPLAFETLARELKPAETAARCVRELAVAAGASQLVGGQSDDLRLENATINPEQLEQIHRRKTGALFTASLKMGCLCAGGTAEQLDSLANFGEHLGLAFQITDDLLDLRGDEAKIGKRTGKDADQGKQTYPGLIGVEASEQLVAEKARSAVHSLRNFDERADDLRRFASFVVNRNR